MRIMLDTNVLVSAIIFPNERMDTLIYKSTLENQLVLSSYIIDELLGITERKFPEKVKHVDTFLTRLPFELVYTPQEPDYNLFYIRDKKDYSALYSAITEGIDLFITGDADFAEVEIEKPEIITPSEFLEKY